MGEVLHGSLLKLLLGHCDFLNIDISQGSVATRLRCGGIFKYELVANLPVSLPVKEFWKSVNIWGSYGQKFGVLFFSETQCTSNTMLFSLYGHEAQGRNHILSDVWIPPGKRTISGVGGHSLQPIVIYRGLWRELQVFCRWHQWCGHSLSLLQQPIGLRITYSTKPQVIHNQSVGYSRAVIPNK